MSEMAILRQNSYLDDKGPHCFAWALPSPGLRGHLPHDPVSVGAVLERCAVQISLCVPNHTSVRSRAVRASEAVQQGQCPFVTQFENRSIIGGSARVGIAIEITLRVPNHASDGIGSIR